MCVCIYAYQDNTAAVFNACSGYGKILPPMVLFPAQHMQSTLEPKISRLRKLSLDICE